MSYVEYNDLKTPNGVLEKMAEYIKAKGYTVVKDVTADLNIYDMSTNDGEKFVFMDKTKTYFINLRSANGVNIFGDTNSTYQDTLPISGGTNVNYTGVGMIVSEGYSDSQRWYSQYKVPVKFATTTALGTYMPVPPGTGSITPVPKPTPVTEPTVVAKPVAPDLPTKPIAPTPPDSWSETSPKIATWSATGGYNGGNKYGTSLGGDNKNPILGGFPAIVIDPNLTHKYGQNTVAFLDFSAGNSSSSLPKFTNVDRFTSTSSVTYTELTYPNSIEALDADGKTTAVSDGTYTWPASTNGSPSGAVPLPQVLYDGASGKHHWLAPYAVAISTDSAYNAAHVNKTYAYSADGTVSVPISIMPTWLFNYLQNSQSAIDAYNTASAQYNTDLENYNTQVNTLTTKYNNAMTAYNAYLVKLNNYNIYLQALSEYNNYLDMLAGIEYKYTLYCNEILSEDSLKSTLTFSLLKQNSKYKQVSHLIVGNINKYDTWDGGIFFSGSACKDNILESVGLYNEGDTSDSVIYPVLSSGSHSNTFLRIDIDNAPTNARGNIYWASSGTDSATGKPLSLPIRVNGGGNGEIPHYYFLQSHNRLDSGKNINTLNCITLNLPIYMAVRVDPDILNNYAAVGSVIGVYFISTYNTQTGSTYEINYPESHETCQSFSMGKRRGTYGFDGISIKQMNEG